jgi:PucR C-terminal helix-turn-helix domain/GGDEF-like domain
MNAREVQQQVADVAGTLYERVDELAVQLVDAITHEVDLYQSAAPAPLDVLAQGCAANLRSVFSAVAAESPFDPTAATELGVARACDGVPLSSVMEAYRVGFRRASQAMVEESAARAHIDGDALRALTVKILTAQEVFTRAMALGYRGEHSRRVSSDASQHTGLLDALLHGRPCNQWSLWELADNLRLPTSGPFIVVAAEPPAPGAEPLAGIESRLRSLDVLSAWCLLPEHKVGIVHLRTDMTLGKVLALVSRMTSTRVGVSAPFDDLRETSQALRYARVTLLGRPDHPGVLVSVFDASILASAAVSAPEVMTKLVAPLLANFADLADDEREILFETFRVWMENGGSPRTTAELLFCHPNTVRYRLHRIEQRTGRTLSRPRDVAELCLAFEVERRLI